MSSITDLPRLPSMAISSPECATTINLDIVFAYLAGRTHSEESRHMRALEEFVNLGGRCRLNARR
jgi:hypothetical protein